ncbi:hypothetical protein [Bordetella genomosp. 1]|uniref:hypothetical protein n=1 Tax=Bordetella genomosp. 1 TaxID=1395607 RepID=UPI0015961C52|nr:hypothetical protein [Bordetella genomosp. 1]
MSGLSAWSARPNEYPIRPSSGAMRAALLALERLQLLFLLVFLFSLAVRPDGEKHERAQHDELERTEDDRDPKIHHFLKRCVRNYIPDAGAGQTPTDDGCDGATPLLRMKFYRQSPYKQLNSWICMVLYGFLFDEIRT